MHGLDLSPELKKHIGELAEAGRWQEVKLRLSAVRHEPWQDPWMLALLSEVFCRLNDPENALAAATEAREGFLRTEDRNGILKATNEMGIARFELGDLAGAETCFHEALQLAETLGAEGMQAKAANNLGALCTLRGRRDEALEYHRVALACFRRLGEVRGQAETYHNLGITYRDLGLAAEADAFFAQAAQRAREAGDDSLFAFALTARAELSLGRQDLRAADGVARQAMMRFDTSASSYGQAEVHKLAGMIAARRGDLEQGLQRLDQALALTDVHGAPLVDAEIRLERGILLCQLGRQEEGMEELGRATEAFDRLGAPELALRSRGLLSDPPGATPASAA